MSTTDSSQTEYHRSYSLPDADLVFVSRDGIKFRVHSPILKLVSGVFRGMLSIPHDTNEGPDDPIPIDENADILAALLDAAYPNIGQDRRALWETLGKSPAALVAAADKYEMSAVMDDLRSRIFHAVPLTLKPTPIMMYGMACKLGWESEAKTASSETLFLDLTSPDSISDLEKLDSRDVLSLQKLHRERRDIIFQSIRDMIRGTSYASVLVDLYFWQDPECVSIFDIEMRCEHGSKCSWYPGFDKGKFIAEIERTIAGLPTTI
ncbi:hypothetical protein DFH11DRAFT_1729149 [Phellopilus nigrolimitatus]|nr:hypothetical protein DFH11DRAFT_1729149 [Phellopilus nigrolimitatus]